MRKLLLLTLAALLSACGEKTMTKPPLDGAVVGMTQRAFDDGDRLSWDRRRARPLATTIWYPADARARVSEISFPVGKPIFVGGWAARDAAVAGEMKRPLAVLSHGTGGSAMQMMWLGRRLAAEGFIVAAIDHHGNTAAELKYDSRGYRLPWERARDISVAIDRLLADPQFGPLIDSERIYGAGYSIGGYAMTLLAGGVTSLDQFDSFCASDRRDATCNPPPEFPDAENQFRTMLDSEPYLRAALAEHRRSFADPRIKSFALIAPSLAHALTDESLLKISAPVLVIAGDKDAAAPPATNAKRLADKIRTSRYQLVPGARHTSFLDACAPTAMRRVGTCREEAGFDREAAHQAAAEAIIRHFDEQPR